MFSYISCIRIIPIILVYLNLPCKKEIDEDLIHIYGKSSINILNKAIGIRKSTYRNILYYRIGKYMPIYVKFLKLLYPPMPNLSIEVKEGIGGGISIYHGNSTIIYAKSIGEKFSTYQNVTIGRGKMINENDIPIIGNNVTIYTGAIVVGGIHIGNNVKIGAGAVVVKDVPNNCTVVGNPMRIIRHETRI